MAASKSKHLSWLQKIRLLIPNLNLFIAVYILLIAVIYLFMVLLPEKIFNLNLSIPAIVYIILSATSILLTTCGEKIGVLVRRLFLSNFIYTEQEQVLDQKKIRFLLILIYFVAIIVFTLASLASYSIFDTDKMDYSVIQSFATYIAYDRLVRNYATINQKV